MWITLLSEPVCKIAAILWHTNMARVTGWMQLSTSSRCNFQVTKIPQSQRWECREWSAEFCHAVVTGTVGLELMSALAKPGCARELGALGIRVNPRPSVLPCQAVKTILIGGQEGIPLTPRTWRKIFLCERVILKASNLFFWGSSHQLS